MTAIVTHDKAVEEKAMKAVSDARCRLILGPSAQAAFFATLALRLKLSVDWTIPTAATDGRRLSINPDFVNALTPAEIVGIVTHEVMHICLDFHGRVGNRNWTLFNIAQDLALNHILVNSGFILPKGCLLPGKDVFADFKPALASEEYYELLVQDIKAWLKHIGDNPDFGGCGIAIDPKDLSEAERSELRAGWAIAISQAAALGRQRGTLPGDLDRMVTETLEPKVNWREVLRNFLSIATREDYTWSYPNRRYIASGLYLPSLAGQGMGCIVLTADTSGSVTQEQFNIMGGEVSGVLECKPCKVIIMYHHVTVYKQEEWQPSDGPMKLSTGISGGTSHVDVFEQIEKLPEKPVCIICLTDLMTEFPATPPDVPVLWASILKGMTAPFGTVLDIE